MNETLLQYWNKVQQYWTRLSKKQKGILIASVALLILAGILVSLSMSKTVYTPVFTNMQPDAAASVKKNLESAGIEYKLSPDGKTISVPENKSASVLIDSASQNWMTGGSGGYEIFRDKGSLTTTDKEFNVKYVDALQGELRKMIRSIQAIADANVVINKPEESAFLSKQKDQASASVVLQIKEGYKLDQNKVDTVYNLVSHSVMNLPLERITVSDQYGQTYKPSNGEGSNASLSGLNDIESHMEIKSKFEKDIKNSVGTLLGTFFGPDKIIVNVTSNMNFDQKNTVEKLVTAPNQLDQKGLEISLQEASESYTSDGGTAPGGVPGTGQTDVPTYPTGSNAGKTNSEKTSRTVNSEVNHITNNIVRTPYELKDLSITVGVEPPKKDDPNSLTQEVRAPIEKALVSIVRAALGNVNPAITDEELAKKVNVIPHSFAQSPGTVTTNSNSNWIYAGIGGLAALLIGLGIFAIVRSRRKAAAANNEFDSPVMVEHPSISIENVTNDNQVRKQLETLAKKKPEEFVSLLRTWLVEE
ncbi:flagellar basal-body MS-ring/collar protein FliF [Paenibacillus sp. KN14-4R]|uniref:flagellar basal-body MS-ring/collar protein FliF n=1 Tax=Paenibacillus sp. KN14-4R TaxID=3445773 RepID=UPI003F9FB8A9